MIYYTIYLLHTWVSYPGKIRQYMLESYQNMAIIQEKFRIILRFVE
jgi:hypothetical protein